jgi:uncharacterized protein YndB with AHSA1/START domain
MAQPAAAKPIAGRPGLTLTRRFRARPEKVWAAWTDPERLIAWFCTTKAKPGTLRAELDVRVGGRYRVSFDMESGEHSEVGGVYREVVPNRKLVFSWAWHSTPERESLVTVSIQPEGSGALMIFSHEQFFDEAARDNHARGWTELFAQLDTQLS